MVLKFAANLSFLFKENENLLDRYAEASKAGFKAVECAFPYDFPAAQVAEARNKANVEQVLINTYPGNLENGELGFAALSGRSRDFQASLDKGIEYCKALDCKRLHIMAGKKLTGIIDTAMDDIYVENLRHASTLLEREGIVGMIEPISPGAVPKYYMNSFQKALDVVKSIGSDSLRLQVDVFHLQLLEGNLTFRLREVLPYTGHIQVAQVPDRHEPDSAGEIDYRYVFNVIENAGWDGYIGLEYNPAGNTVEGLKWIEKMGYTL